jgi:UDP-N-acetylglucosamine--N-acetylmuramyl-(pentapeptide) pyrophosphoryl-undecaprenol N-acetylglucosamine transferase
VSAFLIACGGTGGHLAPGIAIAEELRQRGHACRLLVSRKRVDARLLEKYPYLTFECAPGSGFSLHPVRFAGFLAGLLQSFVFAHRCVRHERPDAVIGFGGFTNFAVALCARLRDIPVALHEANRVPGRTVRWLAPFAQRVFTPAGVRVRGLPLTRTRHVGLPVRRDMRRISRAAARQRLGFDQHHRLVIVLGGSQGASALNAWTKKHLEFFAQEGVQVCCVTGLGKGAEGTIENRARDGSVVLSRFVTFTDRMNELLCAADLVVSRAGAGTIAEAIRCQVPAILVPYPEAADNHQLANAQHFERQGAGLCVDQRHLGTLHREVMDVLLNDWLLARFRHNLRNLEREDAARVVAAELEDLARRHAAPEPAPTAAAA